jgi:plasmid stabilization system protein ParE
VHEVTVLLGAEIEFQEAYGRLQTERRQDAFEAEFADALGNLSCFPRMAPVFHPPYHRWRLIGFPHALYYSIEGNRVFIHAVIDTRADLASTYRRLGIPF